MEDATGLADDQRRTLAKLKTIGLGERFYLAGGSAVAHHLGHRRSIDLDLFSVDGGTDLDAVRMQLLAELDDAQVVAVTDASVRLRVGTTAVDLVRYPYPLLEKSCEGPEQFPTASLLDLAVMKLSAVSRRGIRRDFWDLHAILTRSPVTLDNAVNAYVERFGVAESDVYHVLRSLTYFEDADGETTPPKGLADNHWIAIKHYFLTAVPDTLRRRA
jgi:hypothetical protein